MMSDILNKLAAVLEARKGADPQSSYVAGLYAKGLDAILKKIGEEATETVLAAKTGERDQYTARPSCAVAASASRFIHASVSTLPVPASCAIAGTSPSLFHFTASSQDSFI